MKKMVLIGLLLISQLGCNKGMDKTTGKALGKNEKIIALLETTGALNIGKQMATAMLGQFSSIWKRGGNALDEKSMKILKQRLEEAMDKEMKMGSPLVLELIEIYSKYFSEQNIDDMLQFYKTETGKKMIATMPSMLAESMAAGQKWGQESGARIAEEVIEEVRKEGYKIPEI